MIETAIKLQLLKMMPKVREKLFGIPRKKSGSISFQYLYPDGAGEFVHHKEYNPVSYHPLEENIRSQHLVEHFSQEAILTSYSGKKVLRGSIAAWPVFQDDEVRFFCVDIDDPIYVKKIKKKLIHVLDELGIEYIWEYAGSNRDRAHLWFFYKTTKRIAKRLTEVLIEKAGIENLRQKLEWYPAFKPSQLIRILGGAHLRINGDNKCNSIIFRGKEISDPIGICQAIIDCKLVEESRIIQIISDHIPDYELIKDSGDDPKGILDEIERLGDHKRTQREFIYRPRTDLEIPKELFGLRDWRRERLPIPPVSRTLWSQCQAWHTLINRMTQEEMLDERAGETHDAGLFLHGQFHYNDAVAFGDKSEDGREYAEAFYNKYRYRDPSSHNWDDPTAARAGIQRCETMEAKFNACAGCPFKNIHGFDSPKQLYWGKQLEMEVEEDKPLEAMSAEKIHTKTFKKARKMIINAVKYGDDLALGIRSATGTFKSTSIDQLIAELAKRGRRSLLAVPRSDLMMEHKERIEAEGVEVDVALSHKKIFEVLDLKFDCPNYDNIQEAVKLGVSAGAIKRRYCGGCIHKEKCPYPGQYQRIAETDKKVVIIQHAHFQSPQAMRKILNQRFHTLIIDENFLPSIKKYVKSTKQERTLLRTYKKYKWVRQILSWLKGKKLGNQVAPNRIEPNEKELRKVYKKFEYHTLPWNIPDYIRAINANQKYSIYFGLFKFTPPPDQSQIPVQVLTDATMAKKLVQKILNYKKFVSVGAGYLINVKLYNKDNQIIKVVDTSVSKTELSDKEYFTDCLKIIAHQARNKYNGLSIMVTCYKSDIEPVEKWFHEYHPDIAGRIIVAPMSVGVNDYRDVNVHYMMAGHYATQRDYERMAWEYRNMINHWRIIEGKRVIPNKFPNMSKNAPLSIDQATFHPVTFKLRVGKNKYRRVRFPQFKIIRPKYDFYRLLEMEPLGTSQQAHRLRTYDENLKITIDFDRRYKPGLLYTDYVLFQELKSELPSDGLDIV